MEAMSRRAVRSRLFTWASRILLVLGVLVAWKAFWRFGPGILAPSGKPGPALFAKQARLILTAGLVYPRPLEATVPAPAPASNAAIQLKLMGLRDGAGWTMKALQSGRVEGKDLKVRAGALDLLSITGVGPQQEVDGRETCKVDYRVRWELPDEDRELWNVKHLVDLRPPKGLDVASPGQEARRQATLVRQGWRWACAEDGPPGKRGLSPGDWRRDWPAWIF
jgi:hypothetical protein